MTNSSKIKIPSQLARVNWLDTIIASKLCQGAIQKLEIEWNRRLLPSKMHKFYGNKIFVEAGWVNINITVDEMIKSPDSRGV